jgi:HD-like signal output (HDOD) protein
MSTNPVSVEETPPMTGFDFVRSLAAELSAGKVDLPAFPEVAIRVRRVLSDPDSNVNQVVRVVGSDPTLVARIIRISNSAAFNRGRPVADLRTAVNRLGYNMVRTAAMSFAIAQIRKADKLKGLEHYLDALWRRSTQVAAYAYVLARTCSKVPADEAMLGGMMHGIGKLYVLTRAVDHPELFSDGTTLDALIDEWHAPISKAILENWEFSEDLAEAVGRQDDHSRDGPGDPDLCDVIAIAIVMASQPTDLAGIETQLRALPGARRLGLDTARAADVMVESDAEVTALSSALGASE